MAHRRSLARRHAARGCRHPAVRRARRRDRCRPGARRRRRARPSPLILAVELAEPGGTVNHLILIFDEVIDVTQLPDPEDFTLTIEPATLVEGSSIDLIYAGLASADLFSAAGFTFLKLGLPVAVSADDAMHLEYTPATTPIRDLALNKALPVVGVEAFVASPDDVVAGPMAWVYAIVDTTHGADTVALYLNRPIDASSLPVPTDFDDFAVTITDGATSTVVTPTAVSLFRPDLGFGSLDLTLPVAIERGQTVQVDYTPGATPIRSLAGAAAGPLVDTDVVLILPATSASATVGAASTVSTADGEPTVSDPLATAVHTRLPGRSPSPRGQSRNPRRPATRSLASKS